MYTMLILFIANGTIHTQTMQFSNVVQCEHARSFIRTPFIQSYSWCVQQ